MLSTKFIDTTNECKIINNSLLDELRSYNINKNGSQFNLVFDNGASSSVTSKISTLSSLFDSTYSNTGNIPENTWLPILVSTDEHISNKVLSTEGSITNSNSLLSSGRLGIESFYKFSPKFKRLSVSSQSDMVIDWILNKPDLLYYLCYGVMGWIKILDLSNSRTPGGAAKPLMAFPNGSRLHHSSRPSDVLIKIDNERLLVVDKDSSLLRNDTANFQHLGDNEHILYAASFGNSAVFQLANKYKIENRLNNTTTTTQYDSNELQISGKPAHLWISNGDMFCYYTSEQEKIKSEFLGIPSNSYVSPAVYRDYTNIYRILTLDERRTLNKKQISVSRCYKKLAHILSTGPFGSDFIINSLDYIEIRELVKQYISNHRGIRSIDEEKNLLVSTVSSISKVLQTKIVSGSSGQNNSLYLDTKPSTFAFNNNLITNEIQLFEKLIHKYGAELEVTGNTTISVPAQVPLDNTGIAITQVVRNLCNKTLTNTTVFNNQEISFDKSTIDTQISNDETSIKLLFDGEEAAKIPLYEMAKPEFPAPTQNGRDGTNLLPRMDRASYVPGQLRKDGVTLEADADPEAYIYSTYIDMPRDVLQNILTGNSDTEETQEPQPEPQPEPIGPDMESTGPNPFANQQAGGKEGVKIKFSALDYTAKERFRGRYYIPEKFLDPLVRYSWKIIGGPPAVFIDTDKDESTISNPTLKTTYTGKFTIRCIAYTPFGSFIKDRTIYVIDNAELQAITSLVPGTRIVQITYIDNPNVGKYWDPEIQQWLIPPQLANTDPNQTPVLLNRDALRVHVCKFNKVAISNIGGVFWPISTDFKVQEKIGSLDRGVPQKEVYNLNSAYKFVIGKAKNIATTNVPVSITYKPNNTVIRIHSILLEKIRSKQPGCDQCLSLYDPLLKGSKATIVTGGGRPEDPVNTVNGVSYTRTNKSPDSFTLYEYIWDAEESKIKEGEILKFDFPVISTDFAPDIKTYGGYHPSFLGILGAPAITGLSFPADPKPPFTGQYVAQRPKLLPAVTGYELAYKNTTDPTTHKMCYQKIIPITGGTIPFSKGTFHPHSGWIPYTSPNYAIHANKSSVLKFNPGARESFSFVGPRLQSMGCGTIDLDSNTINSKVYSSSITLGMAPDIRWDAACFCKAPQKTNDKGEEEEDTSWRTEVYNANQKNKDYADIEPRQSNHGYRYLYGGEPKGVELTSNNNSSIVNDEFFTEQTGDNFTYSFAVTGPYVAPEQQNLPDGKIQLRIPTVQNFGIKNIEVKLNFLNYVNTKNLIVKLTVSPDGDNQPPKNTSAEEDLLSQIEQNQTAPESELSEEERADRRVDAAIARRAPPSPIRLGSPAFIDQTFPPKMTYGRYKDNPAVSGGISNSSIAHYIESLMHLNSGSGIGPSSTIAGPQNEIVLLNQEHIQNNGYNFSIKFSDNAPKYNVLYDHNILPSVSVTGTPAPSVASVINKMIVSKESYLSSPYQTNQFCIYQNVIKPGESVNPTLAALNHSDREACLYSAILKHNKLNMNHNSLSKLFTTSLFKNPAPEFGPCPGGGAKQKGPDFNANTKFTLSIIVLDEQDDMIPNDNINNNQYLSGLKQAEATQSSANLFNSLCNWELILHVGDAEKPVPYTNPNLASYGNCDSLSLIDYSKEPSFPGNSYIADLSRYKALLPVANLDAPNLSISDASLCQGDPKDPVGQSLMLRPPEFPTYAIIQIMASIAQAAVGGGGTLIGTLAGLDGVINNPGYQILLDWFKEVAFMTQLENVGRQLYFPSYTKYPFGSPEKILLNVRKTASPRILEEDEEPDPSAAPQTEEDLWHSLEATIFRYKNIPILKPNRYNFLRVHRGFARNVSEFPFKFVNSLSDLIDASFIKTLTIPCDQASSLSTLLSDAPIVINNTIYNDGDLVYIFLQPGPNDNADARQRCADQGGLYVAVKNTSNGSGTSWIKINNNYEDINKATHFMAHNAVLGFNNSIFSNSLSAAFSTSRVIICEGRVPYDIFSVGDTVECYNIRDRDTVLDTSTNEEENTNPNNSTGQSTQTTSIVNRIINTKGLIYKNNKLYSVLIVDQPLSEQNTISPKLDNNIFFLYKPNTTIEKEIHKGYSAWGLDKSSMNPTDIPEYTPTAHSIGSYGDLSPFLYKYSVSNNIRFNQLSDVYSILNNRINDKIKNNKIKFFTYSTGTYDLVPETGVSTSQVHGFAYSANELRANIFDKSERYVIAEPENIRQGGGDGYMLYQRLAEQIKLSTSISNELSQEFMYIKTPGADIAMSGLYGQLEIENDLVEYIPLQQIPYGSSQSSTPSVSGTPNASNASSISSTSANTIGLSDVIQRYKTIDNQNMNPALESLMGQKESTSAVIASSNIKYIRKHLSKLKEDDPGDCHTPTPVNANACYKNRLNKALNMLYVERNELLKLLELHTVAKATVSYRDSNNRATTATGEIFAETEDYIIIKGNSRVDRIVKNNNTIIDRQFVSIFNLPSNHPRKADPSILPKLKANISKDATGAISISYSPVNQNYYWINIDPSQGCVLDFASNPKILISTEYQCTEANPIAIRQVLIDDNVCTNFASFDDLKEGGVEDYGTEMFKHKYIIPSGEVERQKAEYEEKYGDNIIAWKEFTKQRWFNIHGDNAVGLWKNQEITVRSTEKYLVPVPYYELALAKNEDGSFNLAADDNSADVSAAPGYEKCQTTSGSTGGVGLLGSDGSRLGKPVRVNNLLDLNNVDNIEVSIKRIPRQLRGTDLLATIYRYGAKSLFRQANLGSPRIPLDIDSRGLQGSINNSLYCWVCLQKSATGTLEYAELPDFFKLQNEMIFRSFFGSVDRIENKADSLVSYFPWELIPYEYGTKDRE